MALSCFLKKISSPIFKGSVLGSVNKTLIKPTSSVYIIQQQPYHHQLESVRNQAKELSFKHNWNYSSTNHFSTTTTLLASHKKHDHGKLWTLERLLSVALLPLVPAALAVPSQALDTALAVIMVLHTHFGLEAVVVDYVRPILFGNVIPKISLGLLYLLSILTLAGLLNLIYNDFGIANTILKIWRK